MLSIAAKVLFILAGRGKATTGEITDEAKALGWSLSSADIRRVADYLEQLGLVEFQAQTA